MEETKKKESKPFEPLIPIDMNPAEIDQPNTLMGYAHMLDAKLRLCSVLHASGMLPDALKTPQAVLAVVLMGQEYGFSPIKACELFDHIKGRAVMRVAGMTALAFKHGVRFNVLEETDKKCVIEGIRGDSKYTGTFTWEQAVRMELASKENWRKMPEWMLYARCASVVCRRLCPDILAGLYSVEEMEDAIDITPRKAEPEKRMPLWEESGGDDIPATFISKSPEIDRDLVKAATEKAKQLAEARRAASAPKSPEPTYNASGLVDESIITMEKGE